MRLYLDIETIPGQRPGLRDEIAAKITPPGNISKFERVLLLHEVFGDDDVAEAADVIEKILSDLDEQADVEGLTMTEPEQLSDRRKLADLRRQQRAAAKKIYRNQPPIPPGRPPMSVPTIRQALRSLPEIEP